MRPAVMPTGSVGLMGAPHDEQILDWSFIRSSSATTIDA